MGWEWSRRGGGGGKLVNLVVKIGSGRSVIDGYRGVSFSMGLVSDTGKADR